MLDVATLYARLNDAETCVLPRMLDRQTAERPEKTCIIFENGPTWTYSETQRHARSTAAALAALGVAKGTRVLVMLDNGPEIVRISFGLYYLGAVLMPINTELPVPLLQRMIDYGEAELLIAGSEFLEPLAQCSFTHLERVVVVGSELSAHPIREAGVEFLGQDVLSAESPMSPDCDPVVEPWETHTVFFTSGTTGVSKGVECSHIHTATMAIDGLRYLNAEDTFLAPFAYYHIAGAYVPWSVFHVGATMVVVRRFSASRFWQQVRNHDVTAALLLGVMCDFLLNQQETEQDAENPLRLIVQQPLIGSVHTFRKRFGVEVYTQYDKTETSPPITSDLVRDGDDIVAGYCGRIRSGFEARIVDANDRAVPIGEVGELIVRCEVPWVIASRYFNMPDASARAWQNGWHHTGDLFRQDGEGRFFFVDRSKDVIRRRGENISSFEIERELAEHPCIAAGAAYAVPCPEFEGESEIMVAIEAEVGTTIDPDEVVSFLTRRVAPHMLPRYIRVLPTLSRNTTNKIVKTALVSEAITEDTWERPSSKPEKRKMVL